MAQSILRVVNLLQETLSSLQNRFRRLSVDLPVDDRLFSIVPHRHYYLVCIPQYRRFFARFAGDGPSAQHTILYG